MNTATHKTCPMCKELKPRADYHKRADGNCAPYCPPCALLRKRQGRPTQREQRAHIYPEPGLKLCSKCNEAKPLSAFGTTTRPNGKPRIRPACKSCAGIGHRAWAAKAGRGFGRTRAELRAELVAAIYVTPETKVCTKCRAEKPRAEFTKFRDRLKHECKACKSAANVARYERRREAEAQKRAAWKAANPELAREIARQGQHRRRARKAQVECTLTKREWAGIVEAYGGVCLACGRGGDITMDHVVPISKGGGHTAANVQPLCGPCNSSKGTRVIDYRPAARIAA